MNFEFRAIGTVWDIEIESSSPSNIEEVMKKRIAEFETVYSRFLDTSFTAKISNNVGQFVLPEDAKPMFDLYFSLYKQTEGLFTPLIGQNLEEAGYDKNYSLKPQKLSKIPDLLEAVEYDFPNINIKVPVCFDFGGVGKGYLIDIVKQLLSLNKVSDFTINAGGDLLTTTSKVIGLEDPNDKTKVIGTTKITNKSICGSSGNRRRWGGFHHILNPKEQKSPENILAAWVIADKAIIADSLATCLFLVPPEKLNRYYSYEYLILYSDFSTAKSDKFEAELFYA